MNELLTALDSISRELSRSISAFNDLRRIRDLVSEDLRPIFVGAPGRDDMFLLAGNLDSLNCLIDVEIEEAHCLLVSCNKAKDLASKNAHSTSLGQRLQELANVDAAVQDKEIARYVPGLAPLGLSVPAPEDIFDAQCGWGHWTSTLEFHSSTLKKLALQFPSTHPFSPHFGMIVNMLNSIFLWCEEQRKIQVAIEVLSKPNNKFGPDYGSFLRLELLELKRQVVPLPRGEEE